MKTNTYYIHLIILFILIIILLVLTALFNYFYDGGNEFFQSRNLEKKISTALINNKKILVCSNYNDRSVQKELIKHIKHSPQVLTLGSSRTLPVTKELFHGMTFYNASVTGGTLQDDISLYYVFQRNGLQPKVIVISIDPWLLDRNSGEIKWRTSFFNEFRKGEKLIKHDKTWSYQDKFLGIFEKYSQLVSSGYFIASLKNFSLVRKLSLTNLPPNKIIIGPEMDIKNYPNCSLLLPEGGRLNSIAEESVTAATADYLGKKKIIETSHDMTINANDADLFETFITFLKARHINIIFYFPPYEPAAYHTILKDENYRTVYHIENHFLNLAKKYNIKVIGNYNPNKLSLHSNDFIDYIHIKKRALDKIFLLGLSDYPYTQT
ncbi:MAG: hypothetical protein A3F11_02915 [Gammaproteobacteria bacterium RIFCSPHIGHO2_12_FULL_37_14]|nr:MAG: hypothetical protein A3F11_02915 [Gammaproteobacteria bacterium RIFCSPHIGHO2_12_FULL_37_14]